MIVLIVNFNTLPFLKLAVRSAQRHIHQPLRFWLWDNGSTDGSAAWIQDNAHRVYAGLNTFHGHAGALDQMVADARAAFPFEPLLVMDSDVEINKAIDFAEVVEASWDDAHCLYADFHPLPEKDDLGRRLAPRVNPALAFFTAPRYARFSFQPFGREGVYYDVGAYHKEQLGNKAEPSRILVESATHYGNSTWPQNGCEDPEVLKRVEANRTLVERRFADLGYEP